MKNPNNLWRNCSEKGNEDRGMENLKIILGCLKNTVSSTGKVVYKLLGRLSGELRYDQYPSH